MLRTHARHAVAAGVLAALASVGTARAMDSAAAHEASIPFANLGGIYDWEADGDHGIWVQDIRRQWYYAKFMGPCTGLPFAFRVGFVTEPTGALNRWSSVRVRDSGRCYFASFEHSAGPPGPAADRAAQTLIPGLPAGDRRGAGAALGPSARSRHL